MLFWDQHGCLPLRPDAPIDGLFEYLEAGLSMVSVNVGFDAVPWSRTPHILANFRRKILADPVHFVWVQSTDDVLVAKETGRLGVCFDLEGTDALDGDIAMIETYYWLGVRTMLIAYNQPNLAGGGCHGDPRQGLTDFGRDVVREMNRVGMLVDASHCSYQTTLDLFAASTAPVVFSHSVPEGVSPHARNISDEQLKGCAETGGVIGINGVGLFLGDMKVDAESLFRAVDYTVDKVGPEHVGLGLDYVCDQAELNTWISENQELFPPEAGYGGAEAAFAHPSQLGALAERLQGAGYGEEDVRAIMGENFMRVASQVWRSRSHGTEDESPGRA